MGCQSLRGELASAPTRARTSTERLQSQTEQRADGVKAVSRRRRGRVAPALSPADHWSTSAQLLPGDRAFLSPSSCEYGWSAPGRADFASAKLDAGVEASGPHDFAVRSNIVRLRARASLTGWTPPCDSDCAPTLPRPPHPVPNVRDGRETPLVCG